MTRIEAHAAPTYDTPFTREKEPWGGRTMLPVQPRHPDIAIASAAADQASCSAKSGSSGPPLRLSVLSYNVLADSNIVKVPYCPPSATNWGKRREILLKEIFSVRADVVCLQDVDFFQQWWSPQLSSAGYDSLYKQRTCDAGVHREGVAIAWKRDVFDLFASAEIDLNRLGEDEEDRALAGKAAASDNVALMVLLQPWQNSKHPSGACVVCTQLYDDQTPTGDAVRSLQACGLTRTIEAFNADFQLPIVLCGTMNCVPSSGAYEILCRGVEAQDPARPGPTGKPLVEPLSTSSARVRWTPPQDDFESLSPPIDVYELLWVPGGSRFLSGESMMVREAECVVYDPVETESGNVRTKQNPLRSCVVTGLSSGVAYEFRVSAVNALGQGPWGERSDPVRMPLMEGNDPEDKVLLSAASIRLLRQRELFEARRRAQERLANPRAYEVRKLVKVDGMANLSTENLHPFNSVSGLTPRYSDAILHPDAANVCTDTGYPVVQSAAAEADATTSVNPTKGRRRRRGKGNRVERRDADSTYDKDVCSVRRPSCDGSTLGVDDDRTADHSLLGHRTTDSGSTDTQQARRTVTDSSSVGEELPTNRARHLMVNDDSNTVHTVSSRASRFATLKVTGERSTRQKHALGLRSAYMTHWAGGEPAFTTLSDAMSATVDYIFFSCHSLLPGEVLSLPEMGELVGRDISQTELAPVPGSWRPSEWQENPEEPGFAGIWSPYLKENPRKCKHRIPNEIFPSDHLMLMANLYYSEQFCPSNWR